MTLSPKLEDEGPEADAESNTIPTGWEYASLGMLAELKGGITKGQKRRPGESVRAVPYLRVANVQRGYIDLSEVSEIEATEREIEELQLRVGDILFNEGGDRDKLGRGWVWEGQLPLCIHQNHVFRARVRKEVILPKYLSLYSNTFGQRYFLQEGKQTTNLASLSLTKLSALPVPVPPLTEQRRMLNRVEILTTRSRRAKEALDAVPELLDRFRQSVLAAAFRGDLTADWRGKNPDVEPAEELLKRIRAERRRRWEEAELAKMRARGKVPGDDRWKEKYEEPAPVDASELPELPEGWAWATWAQVGLCQNGRPFPSSEYTSAGIKLLRPGNLNVSGDLEWTTSNTKCLPERWAEENADHIVRGDELVMNLTAQSLKDEFLGRVCLSSLGERCLLNQRLARLTPVMLSVRFCLWLFKAPLVRAYIDELNTGSLIQHMFTYQVDRFALPIPPSAEQLEIASRIDTVLDAANRVRESIAEGNSRLIDMDRAILAKAFRGELVPQDPDDEPASVLLERLRAEREQNGKTTNGAGRRRAAASPPPASSNPADPGKKPHASRRS